MTRVFTMPAAIVMLLLLAVPVSAQEIEFCTDPESDFGDEPFACGQVALELSAGAESTVEEVIARSAPEASLRGEADFSEAGYVIEVPTGDEWATVEALRADPDVAAASLLNVGGAAAAVPDTAVQRDAPTGVVALIGLFAVAFIGATTMLVRARQH